MMYVEPTSQYKFIAKPTTSEGNLAVDGTSTTNIVTNVVNIQPSTNTATHFQAPEHLQNKNINRQVSANAAPGLTYDGKRMRKAVQRRTVDYNSSVIRLLESRKWFKSSRNQFAIQPHEIYNIDVVPPAGYIKNPMNAVTTKFVRTSTNKLRCPIFCVVWTPEGRRLVTGASSGEFTLWNGLTFNFETILQAHDRAVRSMVWSHHDVWLLTGDHGGFVKYWQSNMNNVKMYEAHKEPIRGLSFSPSDNKYASCSDDGLVKVWDFYRCIEERQLKGHGADVKCVDWHPSKSLLVSGSKDSQQPIKLWDPKTGNSITTLHSHKSTVMTAKWNSNGNWLLTGSRDHLLKVFDIRVMKELQTFRGHKKEATAVAWHPVHETLFASGGSDGSILFWLTGVDEKAGAMEKAHEGIVWSLAWHPVGHILCSGSNDHSSKFWTRNRPGDTMRDRYNLDICQQEDGEYNEEGATGSVLPGLAAFDANAIIPGMDLPVTAGNVILPQSNDVDEDIDLYGDSGKSARFALPAAQSTTSSNIPPPSSSLTAHSVPLDRSSRPGVLGNYPAGTETIPGLGGTRASVPGLTRGPENEVIRNVDNALNLPRDLPAGPPRSDAGPPRPGFERNENLPHNQAQLRPHLRPPFAPPGNRPQFNPGPRPGFDFFPRGGPGDRDPSLNFRPPGPFPPNQFMPFPGPSGGPHDGRNFRPRGMNDHSRELGPRPSGFGPPRPELRHPDQALRDHESIRSGKEQRGPPVPQDQNSEHGPREKLMMRNNDSPRVSPPRSANSRTRPERRVSDPSAPGILGDYETHARELEQRRRNRQGAGESQPFHRNSFEGGEPGHETKLRPEGPDSRISGQAPDRPAQAPPFRRQNSNHRTGPNFEPRYDRPDISRSGDRLLHDRPDRSRPGERPLRERPDMSIFGDRPPHDRPPHDRPPHDRPPHDRPPHDRPPHDRPPHDRPPNDRADMRHPEDRPFHDRPDMVRHEDHPLHDRPDMSRGGERPLHDRSDMGYSGDRPLHDRPDITRRGDRPLHDRPDMPRSGDRPLHDRPDLTRPGDHPLHDRPDMVRPGDRPLHGREDMSRTGDRPHHERPDVGRSDEPVFRNIPEMGRPDDRPIRDRPSERGPPRDTRPNERGPPRDTRPSERGPPRDTRPNERGPPRDARSNERGPPRDTRPLEGSSQRTPFGRPYEHHNYSPSHDTHFQHSMNERVRLDGPPDRANFDRSPRDRDSHERPDLSQTFEQGTADRFEVRERPPKSEEQGNIKPLMSIVAPRPNQDSQIGVGNQQGVASMDTENRGRKRSIEQEYDRAPKRMEPGDNRERAW